MGISNAVACELSRRATYNDLKICKFGSFGSSQGHYILRGFPVHPRDLGGVEYRLQGITSGKQAHPLAARGASREALRVERMGIGC